MSWGDWMQTVTVYSTQTCGYCKQAKTFLKENGVSFTEKDVNADPEAQREMQNMKAQGVPVIVVDGEIIMGFDKPRLEKLFGKLVVECPECRKKLRLPRNKGTLAVKCPSCGHGFRVDSNKK